MGFEWVPSSCWEKSRLKGRKGRNRERGLGTEFRVVWALWWPGKGELGWSLMLGVSRVGLQVCGWPACETGEEEESESTLEFSA